MEDSVYHKIVILVKLFLKAYLVKFFFLKYQQLIKIDI